MKKMKYIFLGVIILLGILIFKSIFYPPLPMNSISRHDVIEKVNHSHEKLVKISEKNGYQWYASKRDDENDYTELKQLMREKGWDFKKKVDTGIIFQSKQGEIIVSDYMWRNGTRKYIVFYFPKNI